MKALDRHVENLTGLSRWGTIRPRDVILDLADQSSRTTGEPDEPDAEIVPFQGSMLSADGKLLQALSRGLSELTSGLLFADVLIWMFGDKHMREGVLRHRPLGAYNTRDRVSLILFDRASVDSPLSDYHSPGRPEDAVQQVRFQSAQSRHISTRRIRTQRLVCDRSTIGRALDAMQG